MNVSIIVAYSENFAIGKDNQLIWHISDDLKRFKRITTGHAILMGRKNHESIGKALPGRKNIVITRNPAYSSLDCMTAHNLPDAISLASPDDEIFIIGGSEIYKLALEANIVNKLYITIVHRKFKADAFFPKLNFKEWNLLEKETHIDPESGLKFSYKTYTK
jgi:dihydrofolate reductase